MFVVIALLPAAGPLGRVPWTPALGGCSRPLGGVYLPLLVFVFFAIGAQTPPAPGAPTFCAAPCITCCPGGGSAPAPFGAVASAARSGTPPAPGPPPSKTPGA